MAKSKSAGKKEDWWVNAGNAGSGTSSAKHVEKRRFHSASEAQTAADNRMAQLQRGEFEGDLTLPGNAALAAGVDVTLEGFTPTAINGRYIAKSVSHSVSRSGWTTQVKLESLG